MQRIDELLDAAKAQLANSESAQLDAEVLLAHVLGKQRSYLRAYPEIKPEQEAAQAYSRLLARREAGEPVAHLTGEREFWSLNLQVTPDTLIPRPDTELLVETALQRLSEIRNKPIQLADLGTGSGAIALALASECSQCEITATDLSTAALAVAKDNSDRLEINNIEFIHSNWCSAFADDTHFDMIISNPPYIPNNDPHMQAAELKCEPEFALTSGNDGLDALRSITQQAQHFLKPNGWLLVEHGYDQAEAVRTLFRENGYQDIETKQDLGGNDRVCLGQWR
ncbi:MAG: peptide chain release factor N(5)-glutamine methyltransferase [Sulfuriflexus sp.]|nr:peptide chain release factor N(5)-glutamine methyltransferase [Sulfuriflexus sp.]